MPLSEYRHATSAASSLSLPIPGPGLRVLCPAQSYRLAPGQLRFLPRVTCICLLPVENHLNLLEHLRECLRHIRPLHRRRLDEAKLVLLSVGTGLLGRDLSLVVRLVALVPYEHDHDVDICVFPEFRKPRVHALEGLVAGHVVYEEGPHGAAVIGARDGSVSLLACDRV